jgi:hypothetical protein
MLQQVSYYNYLVREDPQFFYRFAPQPPAAAAVCMPKVMKKEKGKKAYLPITSSHFFAQVAGAKL